MMRVVEQSFHAAVLLPGPLSIHKECEAILEGQIQSGGLVEPFFEGVGQAVEFHCVEFFHGLFNKHALSPV